MTPASRRARERAILEIIERTPIETQTELVRALHAQGFSVTQATVSRDIQRLGIVKLRRSNGRPRYTTPDAPSSAPVARRLLQTALREFATGIEPGDALLAIRTQSGCANAVAVAIDDARIDGIVATVAGDDTIILLTRTAEDRTRILDELRPLAAL